MKGFVYIISLLITLLAGCSTEQIKKAEEQLPSELKEEPPKMSTWITGWVVEDWKNEFQEFLKERPTVGHEDAPIVFAQFSSFDCEYCEKWHSEIYPWLKKNYIDTGIVQLTFINVPNEKDIATESATVGLYIYNENHDAFWLYYDEMHSKSVDNLEVLYANATATSGIDINLLRESHDSENVQSMLMENKAIAEEHDVHKLPSFYVNGYRLDFPFDQEKIKEFLDEMLKYHEIEKNS